MIEDCKGVDKSINEVVLVPELAALLQSQACRLGGGGGGLVPRPSYTAADGLHHRYVKRGSGVLVYSFLSRRPGMLGHQSDSRHAIIAYLSYCLKLFVIDDNGGCTASD